MEIEQLKAMVARALADGRLSQSESETIKTAIYADHKVTPEEAQVFRELQSKIWNGEIQIDPD
jgi:uncharacterized membrane protein YebE (DUF533 family)